MTAAGFLSELFKGCHEGEITVTAFPENRIEHFPATETDKAACLVETLGRTSNTFYNLALCKEGLGTYKRGSEEDIHTVVAFCADIDIKGDAHKQPDLPETEEEALGFISSLAIEPSITIDSGNGIHALWLLEEPYVIRTDADRREISAVSAGFGAYLKREGMSHGWILDNVQDITRMLRVPGTLNFKTDPPKECRVISSTSVRYSLSDFAPYKALREDEAEAFTAPDSLSIGPADRMRGRCAFIDYCVDHAETLSEPWWHAMLSIAALTEDGQEKCHEWSEAYPCYSYEETESHRRRMAKNSRPCSCRYIRGTLGFACPEGGCRDCQDTTHTVGGPIVFSYYTVSEQAERLLGEDLTLEEALSARNLSILLHAREEAPSLYVRLKQKYQAGPLRVSSRDLERCLKDREAQEAKAAGKPRSRRAGAEEDFLDWGSVSLTGIDTASLAAPADYCVTMAGVRRISMASGVITEVSPVPVVICRKLVNVDDGTEKLELAFLRNRRWKRLIAPRAQLLNKNTVIKYADNGLPVSSDNAAPLSSFLAKFESVNEIPAFRCISRAGWFGDEFFPYSVKGLVVYQDEYSDTNRAMKALRTGGDEGTWLSMAAKLRKMPVARAMLAAGFASPLLCRLQHRNLYIHIWHDSRSGKTAALKAALSIWGYPPDLMGSYSSTAVGMERLAGTMKHLPLGLDELQSLNQKKMPASEIIYKLGNGIGKMRGLPGGGLRRTEEWNNCIISTGEQPMTNSSSMDGESTRVMEVYGRPIVDETFAGEVHRTSERNFGFAGEKYVRFLTSLCNGGGNCGNGSGNCDGNGGNCDSNCDGGDGNVGGNCDGRPEDRKQDDVRAMQNIQGRLNADLDAISAELRRAVNMDAAGNTGNADRTDKADRTDDVARADETDKTDKAVITDGMEAVSGVYFDNCAVLALADYYSSIAVFGLSHAQAMEEAAGLGRAILGILASERREDTTDSAWEYIKSFVASNTQHFVGSSSLSAITPVYGKIDGRAGKVSFISSAMNRALEDGGFSSRKCIRGFQGRGYIETAADPKGKRRSQSVQRIGGVPSRVYVLNIGEIRPPEDAFGVLEDLPPLS